MHYNAKDDHYTLRVQKSILKWYRENLGFIQRGQRHEHTVKPRFTGPLGGKGLGPVNREARYIGLHFTLIYTQSLFLGDGIEAR